MLPRTKATVNSDGDRWHNSLVKRPTATTTTTNSTDARRPFYDHLGNGHAASKPRTSTPSSSRTRPLSKRRLATLVLFAIGGTLAVWIVYSRWTNPKKEPPRKKLDYRWWEVDEPPLEDLAALLPKPSIAPLNPSPPIAIPSSSADRKQQQPASSPSSSSSSGHTHAQLLRLPSTFSTASPPITWTAVLHFHTADSVSPARLTSLLTSLNAQKPVRPIRILLLLPRTVRPPSEEVLAPFGYQDPKRGEGAGGKLAIVSYSLTRGQPPRERDHAALMALIRAASTGEIDSDYLLFVDGAAANEAGDGVFSPTAAAGGAQYVHALLHASGTTEYRASLLSGGGLVLATSDNPDHHHHLSSDDLCVFPLRESTSTTPKSTTTSVTRLISIPTLPFLLPVSWLVPRDPSDPTHTSIVQGIPPSSQLGELGLAGTLAAALWTKHAIPSYAVPVLLSSSTGAGKCERLRTALARQEGEEGENDRRFATSASSTAITATSHSSVRELFAPHFGAGEGLRLSRLNRDRSRGGASSSEEAQGRGPKTPLERAEELKSELLQTGTAVILVSGAEELEAVRGLACRFAAQGVGRRESEEQEARQEEQQEGTARRRSQNADRRDRPRVRRDLKVVVADLDFATWSDPSSSSSTTGGACHLDLTPLRGGTLTSGSDGAAISVPLLDLLESLNPRPAFILYLTDSPRAREFEEVLRWSGGYFGPKQGQTRLSRVRAERTMLRGGGAGAGGGNKIRPTVVGMPREEAKRAEWIGALSLEALRNFHTPRIDISVVTNNRPVSLHRLLTSLRTAHYFGDEVSLALNLEQTSDRLTHRLVDDLSWTHGPLSIRHRILLGGLMPAIVESWYPASNDTYGVLLEDDVEVSPLFYGWLKFAILHYRYTLAGRRASPRLFGISLYQQKNIELRPEGRQPFDAHALFRDLSLSPTTPYLSQIPCSWGAAYFPEQWREFHTYLALRLSELALSVSDPIVPEIRSNRWPRSWKKYFIELVYLRGYAMLYPNYPGFESLSTNHLEVGTHVHTAVELKKKALFEVPLLPRTASLVHSLPGPPGLEHLPAWGSLPIIDLWGSLATAEELLERGWQTTRMIGSCGSDQLPSLEPRHLTRPRYDAHELLCRRVWDRENDGRLVDAQPLRGTSADDEDDDDLLPHSRRLGANLNGSRLGDARPDRDDLGQDEVGGGSGRRAVDLMDTARGAAAGKHDEEDDVPTVARLDILPTEIDDDREEAPRRKPPPPPLRPGFA
ncbi:hypothetical protein JCM10908_001842 [Rhodotorula pacifica]|uniref:uncharacterized protein n=1 Tax=Rhodotorula pacifica TaxID=1495444 RepID=UPI00317D5936